uniref:Uncharacterized protein n=1 Tax=Setaria viridis TaxID=4556 RepID=A0A4U6TUV3_SETVI|nr:hypothetical protein SEVIR_7G166600v2 [Setaria viridis]
MATNGGDAPADTPADARQCICSPTTHPGSFRCRLHRGAGMPRSASCQQFGAAAAAPGSRSLCSSSHMRRAVFQQQFAVRSTTVNGGMSRSSSEQLLCPLGVSRSASWQDFFPKERPEL